MIIDKNATAFTMTGKLSTNEKGERVFIHFMDVNCPAFTYKVGEIFDELVEQNKKCEITIVVKHNYD